VFKVKDRADWARYAMSRLPKAIRNNSEYSGVNDLANENVPQPLMVNRHSLKMTMEDERESVMNSHMKVETANATMKLGPMKMIHDIF